ncbi:MAG: hypothetical protein DPW18_17970 [Chloroflexi bacterium]|nr:hypothetical protein [Chloroflexota bacterium]MDL1941926.1 hypothetical protein [Chloroflexi bacterium CFX2]
MPENRPDFDPQTVHRYFSAACFNQTWEYINNPNRTAEDDFAMLHTAMTSLWHWTQREDVTPTNLSIGYWQVSRVYALLGQADNARCYAETCLKHSEGIEPEYIGFAYEALARAELVAGNKTKMDEYLAKAREYAAKVQDPEDREILENDLSTIK